MCYNHDSDKSSIYNKIYGDQDLFEIPNENTSLKEKEPEKNNDEKYDTQPNIEKNKKSPFSFDRCQIGLEEKNTEAKTYKEQKKENDAYSCLHSFTDFLNQIAKSYDSDDTLPYPDLNNLLVTWPLKELKRKRIYPIFIYDSLGNKKILDTLIKKGLEHKKTLFQNIMDFTLGELLDYFLKDDKVIIYDSYIYLLDNFKTYYDMHGQKKVLNKKRKAPKEN